MKCSAILVGIKELCRLYLIHDKIMQGHTFLSRRNVGQSAHPVNIWDGEMLRC